MAPSPEMAILEHAWLSTLIVAPNEVPAGATTAAGAVLTKSAGMAPGEVWAGVPARRLGTSKKSNEDTSSVSHTSQKEEGQR